jgi:hypothetical protein
MPRRLHPIAGMTALLTILNFWVATVAAELFGSAATVATVKQTIPWFFLLLVPALALAGTTGMRLADASPAARVKARRMRLIAANGLLVLAPSAIALAILAAEGDFGPRFIVLQGLELTAGAVNILLMARSALDGKRLARARVCPVQAEPRFSSRHPRA